MGTKLMVSVWPSLSPLSSNYQPMLDRGLLISNEQGTAVHSNWPERGVSALDRRLLSTTPPAPRPASTSGTKSRSRTTKLGVRVFWLDACEPEMRPYSPGGLDGTPPARARGGQPLSHASMLGPFTKA